MKYIQIQYNESVDEALQDFQDAYRLLYGQKIARALVLESLIEEKAKFLVKDADRMREEYKKQKTIVRERKEEIKRRITTGFKKKVNE